MKEVIGAREAEDVGLLIVSKTCKESVLLHRNLLTPQHIHVEVVELELSRESLYLHDLLDRLAMYGLLNWPKMITLVERPQGSSESIVLLGLYPRYLVLNSLSILTALDS